MPRCPATGVFVLPIPAPLCANNSGLRPDITPSKGNETVNRAYLAAAIALAGVVPCSAGIENGSFELGNLSKWSVRSGKTSSSPSVNKFNLPINWNLWQADVTWSTYSNWPGVPNTVTATRALAVQQTPAPQPYQLNFNKPLDGVFQGAINHNPTLEAIPLLGNYDVTHLATKGEVKPTDIQNGTYTLYVNWAALLENPTHDHWEQPAFLVRLGRKKYTAGAYGAWTYTIKFHAGDDQATEGWFPIANRRQLGDNPNAPLFGNTFKETLPLTLQDSISIDLVSIDCSQGGHGAMAFIDAVGFTEPDPCAWGNCKIDTLGLPCIYGKSLVTLSSNSKVKSNIGSDTYLLMDADSKDTGTIFARGTFKMADRSTHVGDLRISGTFDSSKAPYNAAKRIGSKSTEAFVFMPSTLPTYTVVPGTNDVMTYIGKGKTVLQGGGNYKNLMANGDTLVFKAGTYHFASVTLNQPTVVIFDNSAGPIKILSKGKVSVDNIKNISLVPQGADKTTNVLVYSDATNNYLWDAAISLQSGTNVFKFDALAPKGMLAARQATIIGYGHAKSVQVEAGATFKCREGFAN